MWKGKVEREGAQHLSKGNETKYPRKWKEIPVVRLYTGANADANHVLVITKTKMTIGRSTVNLVWRRK